MKNKPIFTMSKGNAFKIASSAPSTSNETKLIRYISTAVNIKSRGIENTATDGALGSSEFAHFFIVSV